MAKQKRKWILLDPNNSDSLMAEHIYVSLTQTIKQALDSKLNLSGGTLTGNLGIGVAPSTKLDIQDGDARFQVSGSVTSGYNSHWKLDDTGLKFGHNSASRNIEFQVGGSTKLHIATNGNIGIDGNSPNVRLGINYASNAVNTLGTNAIGLLVKRTDAATDAWAASLGLEGFGGKGVKLLGGGFGFNIEYWNGTANTKFLEFDSLGAATFVDDTLVKGDLGVGPSAPLFPLDIFKSGSSVTISGISTYIDVASIRTGVGRGLIIGADDNTAFIRSSYINTDLIFATRYNPGTGNENFERLRIKADGDSVFAKSVSSSGGGSYGEGTQKLASEKYIQSRINDLVTNGTAFLQNNYNFSAWTYDPVEAFSANGSFKHTGAYAVKILDEAIPVDASKAYRGSIYAKSDETTRLYWFAASYDVDNNAITAIHHMRQAGTDTTLAQPLAPGDTIVYLTDASNWNDSSTASSHFRTLSIYGYANSYGYVYPDYTYTRRYISDAWLGGGSIDYVNNTITLRNPFPSTWGTLPIGTAVSNGQSGGTYKYFVANNYFTTTSWVKQEGIIKGIDTSGTNKTTEFAPGTAYIKLGGLINYQNHTSVNSTVWLSNISFAEADVMSESDAVLSTLELTGTASTLVLPHNGSIYGKNSSGVSEACLYPRFNNTTYLDYGLNGWYIRNSAAATSAFFNNSGNLYLGGSTSATDRLEVNGFCMTSSGYKVGANTVIDSTRHGVLSTLDVEGELEVGSTATNPTIQLGATAYRLRLVGKVLNLEDFAIVDAPDFAIGYSGGTPYIKLSSHGDSHINNGGGLAIGKTTITTGYKVDIIGSVKVSDEVLSDKVKATSKMNIPQGGTTNLTENGDISLGTFSGMNSIFFRLGGTNYYIGGNALV